MKGLIETVRLQRDTSFCFSHACVHACVCVGGASFVAVAVWASDRVGAICDFFFNFFFLIYGNL